MRAQLGHPAISRPTADGSATATLAARLAVLPMMSSVHGSRPLRLPWRESRSRDIDEGSLGLAPIGDRADQHSTQVTGDHFLTDRHAGRPILPFPAPVMAAVVRPAVVPGALHPATTQPAAQKTAQQITPPHAGTCCAGALGSFEIRDAHDCGMGDLA
jgi:hypothetical protein